MREIRFRAWHKERGVMFYAGDNYGTRDPMDCCVYYQQGQPVILMQFTGLRDRNGKEIWEGDFLGGMWGGYLSWCDKCKQTQFFYRQLGCAACEGDVHWAEVVEDDGKLEVIGNIYENPELLEEGK